MENVISKLKVGVEPGSLKRKRKGFLTPWLFAFPALIPLAIFWIYPMLYSVYLSFTDWDYMSPEYNIIWLENYLEIFQSPTFYGVLWNTLYFSVGTVMPTVVGGLLLALLLANKQKGMGIYRTILFSPWVTPTVAVSIVWSWIFEPRIGLANWFLSLFHLQALEWTGSSTWAMPAIIIVTVWKSVGWSMIFYLNALKKVPADLYEAASIDGATEWQKFLKITLPLISPTTLFLVIITTIESLQAYDQIQVMTQGGPAGSTRTLLYMYYQSAFQEFNMGKATAVATVLVIITAVLSLLQFVLSRKWVHYH